ncbi:hypothetical protein M378DRAFT_168391 [Amanita muscaria Koide BX008]|uniref:Uncharacterized protein n=1 Tax=Amanita muscaria (strain Koide BX008) TaxID=946122 RepID=A0A0C2WTQ0_AMAMK|nr:hypothetical protein M378DRAFT_168391 [Amanita muscaria Koide BX008]
MRDSSTPLLSRSPNLNVGTSCPESGPPILSFPGFGWHIPQPELRSLALLGLWHLANNQSYVVDPNRHLYSEYPGHSVCGHLIVSLSFTGIDDTMMLTSSRYRAREDRNYPTSIVKTAFRLSAARMFRKRAISRYSMQKT